MDTQIKNLEKRIEKLEAVCGGMIVIIDTYHDLLNEKGISAYDVLKRLRTKREELKNEFTHMR